MTDLYASMLPQETPPAVNTLFVNLITGPGVGKSTTSTGVYSKLKQAGYNAEYVSEFAKDKTWESEDHPALFCQPYIAGKQFWRQFRVNGKVDVAITDTSLLLSLIYQTFGSTPSFNKAIVEQYNLFTNLPILLARDPSRPYNPKGRRQSKEEAEELDRRILEMLKENSIPFQVVQMTDNDAVQFEIVDMVKNHLERLRNSSNLLTTR